LLLHKKLNRAAEAEDAYRQAIARDPNLAEAYLNLGNLLAKLNRAAEAEGTYLKGLDASPNDTAILNNLILLLRLQRRERDAVPYLEKWLAIAPQDLNPLLALASIHKLFSDLAASAKYAAQARGFIPRDDWYNLTCLESVCGNVDLALEHLRRAAGRESFDRQWAWRDPDFVWIRDDPRFGEIVGNAR